MARTLTSAMQTAVAAAEGYADLWLISIESSGGTTRLATAPHDIDWNSVTWTGIGGAMSFGPQEETEDLQGQQTEIMLSGVDTTIISLLLTNFTRGREVLIYLAQIDTALGTVVADPLESFRGILNGSWDIVETMDDRGPGTVTVRTSALSYLAGEGGKRTTATNTQSHNAFLDRAGATPALPDSFFKRVPRIMGQSIFWGVRLSLRGRGGGQGGDGRTERE